MKVHTIVKQLNVVSFLKLREFPMWKIGNSSFLDPKIPRFQKIGNSPFFLKGVAAERTGDLAKGADGVSNPRMTRYSKQTKYCPIIFIRLL
jgi:hypothetical protein